MKNRALHILNWISIIAVVMVLFTSCKDEETISAPVISSFSPESGTTGTTVIITGSNFSTTLADNVVKFNEAVATVSAASATSLTVTVPDGATTGKITITANGLTSSSANDFELTKSVYVAGYTYKNPNEDVYVATYWKDGVATSLSDGTSHSSIHAIHIEGNDVYMAGALGTSVDVRAAYWKNDVATPLTNGTADASASDIYVSGSDVYVAGREHNGSEYVAKYWKNGAETILTDGTKEAYTTSIYVSGTDVHVVGYEYNGSKYIAKYWKNGIAASLSDGTQSAIAKSVVVSGSDVYVAGYNGDVALYWKNGVATNLTDGINNAEAHAIYIAGSDIYVSGTEFDNNQYVAKYWKNGVVANLPEGQVATSIFISDTDVYAAGYDGNSVTKSKYWKNGVVTNLTDGTKPAYAVAICVK